MSNEIHISGKQTGECTVKGERLEADVTPDYCLINLREQTMRLNPADYDNMETILELARQVRYERGIYD